MNKQKLNYLIGYVRAQPEFPFDVFDVDENIEAILAHYRLSPCMDDDERHVLRSEFLTLASNAQLAESARTTEARDFPELAWLPEKPPRVPRHKPDPAAVREAALRLMAFLRG